jgi:uncharacterized protein (TIGR00730 family)
MVKSICVFCGSSSGNNANYENATDTIGREIAARGVKLIYGGGGLGLMGTLIAAARKEGCETLGILPEFLTTNQPTIGAFGHHILVGDIFERKSLMLENSDCFVVLPGGIGTYDEFFEILAWKQLGQASQNIGLLNIDNFFDPLLMLIDQGVAEGFIHRSVRQSIIVEVLPQNLLNKLID